MGDAPGQAPDALHLLGLLELLLQGLANKQIAAALNLSEHTVKDHVAAILERLGARNRVEAIARLRGVRLELPY